MTNGNNSSDQNRVNRSTYDQVDGQRTERLVDQPTLANHDGNTSHTTAQNATAHDSVSARSTTHDEVVYRNGYVEGQNQQRIHEDLQRTRAENSAATGTLIGFLIASIAGLILAALYFLPGNRQPQVTPAPAASPAQPQSDTQPQDTNQTTTIERVREAPASPQSNEVIVIPSSPQPAQPAPSQPNLTQPYPNQSSPEVSPDGSVIDPVDPAIPADPNQPLSQPSTPLDSTLSQPSAAPDAAETDGSVN